MKLRDIKETGFYCEINDLERKIIFEIIENTDEEWLKEDSKATLLIDTWIYDSKDENDRSIYCADSNLSSVYFEESTINIVKIEDVKYKVFGKYGHFLMEDKLTYKEQLEISQARVKELEEKLNAQFVEMEEKLTTEENKNFELKEEIKELRDLNRRLDNQREEYWKEYLKLEEKLKIAEEALQYYAYDVEKNKITGGPDLYRYVMNSYLDIYTNTAKQALKQIGSISEQVVNK